MHQPDPRETRRRGTRRVRIATATVAGAAVAATGVLTVVVAQDHPAAAAETSVVSTSDSAGSPSQRPQGPGGFGSASGERPDASSGGS